MTQRTFADLEAFYAAAERRQNSLEDDYGVHWRDAEGYDRWRVSYVLATGEVYARREYSPMVIVLGVVPPNPVRGGRYYHQTLDGILQGWAVRCGKPRSLEWVQDRLKAYRQPDP